jgi:hypothetical protein
VSISQRIVDPITVNPYFADFNIDDLGPQINEGPTETRLIELVHAGRCGRKQAQFEFADVMYYTLREEAFEAFQRCHGPVESSFREWYYEKLFQFIRILLFDSLHMTGFVDGNLVFKNADFPLDKGFTIISLNGEVVQPDEIEQSIEPKHNSHRLWYELAQAVTEHPKDRLEAAQEWLARFRRQYGRPSPFERGWEKNQDRNRIILNLLDRGMARADICKELDKHTIPTIPALQARELYKWADGWMDPEGRGAIQTLFSKLLARRA